MLRKLFLLLVGHAVADFALQSEAMVKYKNHFTDRGKENPHWAYWMSSHALIHAGFVYLITNSLPLAMVEFVIHWITDFQKNDGWIGAGYDQTVHIVSKIYYSLF